MERIYREQFNHPRDIRAMVSSSGHGGTKNTRIKISIQGTMQPFKM